MVMEEETEKDRIEVRGSMVSIMISIAIVIFLVAMGYIKLC